MRFLKRLIPAVPDAPGLVEVEASAVLAASGPSAERRREPFKCRACGRVRPPYVYAENAHHYCVDCARRSWKLMRLKPVSRRREDQDLEQSVMAENAD